MAKLYFRYGAMNSGKTTALLQVAHNYGERGQEVLIVKPSVDTKGGDRVVSRLGASRPVRLWAAGEALPATARTVACVLVDESQFLTPAQVEELFLLAVEHSVPVICYGLRTDYRSRSFPGSARLMELAHSLEELKTICRCGRKAIFSAVLVDGRVEVPHGQVLIDDGSYTSESLCGACYLRRGGTVSEQPRGTATVGK